MQNNILKRSLPHLLALAIFIVISFVYFSPVLDGKELVGHDTESWQGMAHQNMEYNKTHEDGALWVNSMFGGMPAYQIAMPGGTYSILTPIKSVLAQIPMPVHALILYLVGFYIMLVSLKISPWLSVAGAIAFAFCSYNFIILVAGHNTKALAIAYMAPLIGSIIFAFRRNRYGGALLTAFFLALAISANHVQILYYTLIILIIYGISEIVYSIKEKQIKELLITFGLLLGMAMLAIAMNATMLWTTQEYSRYTMRGESNGLSETIDKESHQEGLNHDYITQWSYGIGETMTLLIPNFNGGASAGKLTATSALGEKIREMRGGNITDEEVQILLDQYFAQLPLYWGSQPFTSGPVYAGAIVCFLFVLGLMLVEGRYKWWILAATILSVLLAWGKNFMPFTELFINYVPLYNMFRAVSMTLVITTFCMALMAVLALKAFFDTGISDEKKKKAILTAGGIVGGLALVYALIPSMAGDFRTSADAQLAQYGYPEWMATVLSLDRAALLRADAFRSLMFVAVAFALLWLSLSYKKMKPEWAIALFALLFLADMVPIAQRYLNNGHFDEPQTVRFEASIADKEILKDTTEFRVLDITENVFNSSKPAYFHNLIGGYHAAKLRRYQEVINIHLTKEIGMITTSFKAAQQVQSFAPIYQALEKCQVLNMLNMKYLIYSKGVPPLVNPYTNGNVWLVDSVLPAKTPDEEMLKLGEINTKQALIVDTANFVGEVKGDFFQSFPAENDTVFLVSYSPNVLKYKSKTANNRFAVFSEIYYPAGWNVYIDGEKRDYLRADYLLRAVRLPAGEHDVEFRFEPASYHIGRLIQMISSLVFVLFAGAILFIYYRKRNHQN